MKLYGKLTLSEQVEEILRDQIIRGEYHQGEKVQEENLARYFSVSRATVREAMRCLESEGLFDRQVNKYTSVHEFSRKEIRDLFAVRCMMEKDAIDYCLENHRIPVEEMRSFLLKMEKATQEGWSAWAEYLSADIRFHKAAIIAMGNRYFLEFWNKIESRYLMAIYMLRKYNPQAFFGTIEDHERILIGLENGSSEEWKQHLKGVSHDVDVMSGALVRDGVLRENNADSMG